MVAASDSNHTLGLGVVGVGGNEPAVRRRQPENRRKIVSDGVLEQLPGPLVVADEQDAPGAMRSGKRLDEAAGEDQLAVHLPAARDLIDAEDGGEDCDGGPDMPGSS